VVEIISFYLNVISGMCILWGDDTKKINMNLFLLVVNVSWRQYKSYVLANQVQQVNYVKDTKYLNCLVVVKTKFRY